MPNANGKKNILLVDDDDISLCMAESMLEEDYNVITAESGKKALELMYNNFIPDLIFLDIFMPEMDGWETFHRVRAVGFLHNVPIVFLTSLDGIEDKKYAQKLGAADYITKPLDRDVLLECIETVLKKGVTKP